MTTPINCGAKDVVAQVVSTLDTSSISPAAAIESAKAKGAGEKNNLVETRFPSCRLHCLVNIERSSLCNNTHAGKVMAIFTFFDPQFSIRYLGPIILMISFLINQE